MVKRVIYYYYTFRRSWSVFKNPAPKIFDSVFFIGSVCFFQDTHSCTRLRRAWSFRRLLPLRFSSWFGFLLFFRHILYRTRALVLV
jgi:hypothetical protein